MNYPYPGYVPSYDPPEPDYMNWDDEMTEEDERILVEEADMREEERLDEIAFGPWAPPGEHLSF